MIEQSTSPRYKDIIKEVESSRRTIRYFEDYKDLFGFNCKELNGKSILDLGAGDSTFAEDLVGIAKEVVRLDPKYSDNSPEYRKGAIAGIAQNLPFRDNSFDEVLASVSLYWIKTGLDDALLEMIRVTKPEGQIRIFPAEPVELKRSIETVQCSPSTRLAYVSKHKSQLPTLFIKKVPSYKPQDWRNEVSNIMREVYL